MLVIVANNVLQNYSLARCILLYPAGYRRGYVHTVTHLAPKYFLHMQPKPIMVPMTTRPRPMHTAITIQPVVVGSVDSTVERVTSLNVSFLLYVTSLTGSVIVVGVSLVVVVGSVVVVVGLVVVMVVSVVVVVGSVVVVVVST